MSHPPLENTLSRTEANSVLLIGERLKCHERVAEKFNNAGFEVTVAKSATAARDRLTQQYFDAVVTVYQLSDQNELQFLNEVRSEQPETACILFTDLDRSEINTTNQPAVVVQYIDASQPDAVTTLIKRARKAIRDRVHASYPLPSDETERLAILEKYLDVESDVEAAFDRLVYLAKSTLETDVAFVGLVGRYTEGIVACRGVNWQFLHRQESVCTYGVLTDGVTVISDLTEDPRFKHSDVVTEDNLRSYAGSPLISPDGYRIGMFCVMDEEPRSYDGEEQQQLVAFAAEAMEQLELRVNKQPRKAAIY